MDEDFRTDEESQFQIAYTGAPLGLPVLARDGHQFGLLEHVLAVDTEDIFEGIVVWTGGGGWGERKVQRELSAGHQSAARFLETFRHGELRFVGADQIGVITQAYIRCDLDQDQVAQLQPPAGAPVYKASAIDQPLPQQQGGYYPGGYGNQGYGNQFYGGLFGRSRWRQQ